uniref:Uncharacterized protein n=1 Tax=Nelumbo nucifera TaxID=4432 RepID=A0A822Y0Q3_NELNU|nr:TPA_asm: hypothetical protein HUJ06_024681 [Nelumbo nucifera]
MDDDYLRMPERSPISFSTIIGGFADSGEFMGAFHLLLLMWQEFPDSGFRMFPTIVRLLFGWYL